MCKAQVIAIPALLNKYRFEETFLKLCEECENHGNNWACPPLEFNADTYLHSFSYAYIIGIKITYGTETLRLNNTNEKAKAFTWRIFSNAKVQLMELLASLEQQTPDSVAVSAGGCDICNICRRKENNPCLFPPKMHRSFEAYGFDLSLITQDLFNITLQWSKDLLPEYHTFVNAIFTKQLDDSILDKMKKFELSL